MADVSPKVEALRQWLALQFPGARIDTQDSFDRETQLFRVQVPTGRPPELELSREVLEDSSSDVIVRELTQSDTVARMKRDPSVRIQYFRSGINHFETRYIQCDSRQYRVVRDDKHNVTIYDAIDKRLVNLPSQMLVLPASIFQLQVAEWCAKIRVWRGEGQ